MVGIAFESTGMFEDRRWYMHHSFPDFADCGFDRDGWIYIRCTGRLRS
jgi:hypothetical protein